MTSSAFAIVAEFPTSAISTRSRPPRTYVSGSGLPAAAPAPRDARLAAVAGARTVGPKRRTSRRIYGPAGCPDGILGTACPPPKLRPTQSAPGFKPNQAGASDVTEIICLVTVTRDGNGVAAARPAMIPTGACGSGSDRARPASPGRHTAPAGAVTPCELPPMDRAASPVPGPGRVASRGRLRRQRVRATPSRRLLPRAHEGKSR